ncbi:MAG: DNA polymerase III subunit alpha [Bacteroidetes bacterium]|nr:MAG: DNA polymerase III subunit alpha [Bacteroidota bacterium]
MGYIELQVTSNFSFLQGASHPEEIVEQAALLGYNAVAITDVNSFAGLVRAHVAAKNKGIRLITGVHLQLMHGVSVLAYPKNAKGYSELCGLLTMGNLRASKGICHLNPEDVTKHLTQVIVVALPPVNLSPNGASIGSFEAELQAYKKVFAQNLYLALHRHYRSNDAKMLALLQNTANRMGIKTVATNNVLYHVPQRRALQDILTCIREKCTIYQAGFKLNAHAERHLKTAQQMQRLFANHAQALANTLHIAAECTFSLDALKYEYPEEITNQQYTPQQTLTQLTWEGAHDFYKGEIPSQITANINHELAFIAQMNYAPYFLTVYDIVRFARQRGILCQGRGSAANSTVCFCLGITSVNPAKFDLLFERFLSAARNEPPDIDVDFEHERREEVIQYIYQKYGRHRAAIVATVTQQHEKGAIRDVARAMGLSQDVIKNLSGLILRSGGQGFNLQQVAAAGINANDVHLQKVIALTNAYMGFPRQLGQHTGGFVICRNTLAELCPVHHARMPNRTCIEWNKDDIDALGFLKVDILALGMLTCIRKAFDLAEQIHGVKLTLANIPQDDEAVYDMICEADTIGVFQIESRAQQSMLPRLRPRCFYDLVIEVAIVRPGPIQGDMVHPYLRRRNGLEPVHYPSKALEAILSRTLGVPLFQEQAMKIAIVAAGFSPTEADQLRRSMATFKSKGLVTHFEKKLIDGMLKNGYALEYAQRVFKQLEGFGSYGFPESHAASFAQLVYVSSWLKCHYPHVFACALLNSLPMGFYQPAQIVADAQKHGVVVRPVDVNHSAWNNTLEEKQGNYHALRLGFKQVSGLRKTDVDLLLQARKQSFTHLLQLSDVGVSNSGIELLAQADAFTSLQIDRRLALWQASVNDKPIALFKGTAHNDEAENNLPLPTMHLAQQVMQDYASTALSLKAHPLSFLRQKLSLLKTITNAALPTTTAGHMATIAGMVLVRQRPQTAKGVWFYTLEDETGVANLVIFPNVFEAHRKVLLQAKILMVSGKVQIEGKVIHVLVSSCFNITKMLATAVATPAEEEDNLGLFSAEQLEHKTTPLPTVPAQALNLPVGRNFR